MWVVITFIIIAVTIIVMVCMFLFFYKNDKIGRDFLYRSEKLANRKAPSVYYDKQMLYRKYYALALIMHYVLTIGSVILTAFNIYAAMDDKLGSNTKLVLLVLVAICMNLQMALRLDRLAERYSVAIRTVEMAILNYESVQDNDISILLEANLKAEEIIHNNVL